MRGGLDDALDKLARRDELRRRAEEDPGGTPTAVTELVEAIAAVVGRHPGLGLTVGVEGVSDPLLLHFFFADGQVQVNAENAPNAAPGSPGAPRHADFVVDVEEQPYSAPPAAHFRPSQDDQDQFGYAPPAHDPYYADSDTAERRYGSFDDPPPEPAGFTPAGETSRDLGARMRDLGMASTRGEGMFPPHPFAPTPPPQVPPQDYAPQPHFAPQPEAAAPPPPPTMPTMPAPLPKPIPLQVEKPEETEMAARRLAALLRDDPSLLSRPE